MSIEVWESAAIDPKVLKLNSTVDLTLDYMMWVDFEHFTDLKSQQIF